MPSAPVTPFAISGKVYEPNGSLANKVTVVALETDTNESISFTTSANGEYMIDLANLKNGYTDGDIVHVYAVRKDDKLKYFDFKFAIDTDTGFKEQDITLNTEVFVLGGRKSEVDIANAEHDILSGAKKTISINHLLPKEYDYVEMSYVGGNMTLAVFKKGGSNGVTVTTINLTYDGRDLITVTKV